MEQSSENVFTKFISITTHLGLSGLGFGLLRGFLIEGEVIAPIPPRVRDRAAVDHSGVIGELDGHLLAKP